MSCNCCLIGGEMLFSGLTVREGRQEGSPVTTPASDADEQPSELIAEYIYCPCKPPLDWWDNWGLLHMASPWQNKGCSSHVHCRRWKCLPHIRLLASDRDGAGIKMGNRSSHCKDPSLPILSADALHPLYLSLHLSLSLSLLLYQGTETPWEALISSAHPEELMTSNVPVNAEKAEHPS